jgi:Rieske Fe-S protein
MGAAVPEGPSLTLASIAKDPSAYLGKTVVTTGTVQAVCQHMGCWMTLKDDAQAEAFVRMAGHSFFIPKSANGRKARVQARLVDSEAPAKACGAGAGAEHKMGCKEEAEKTNGKPLAKLELEALGVELF